ncbi:hypothetical protein [Lewinella sp. JB7]|nr:hypothetical protein [Lewinella sp. JB7]
MPPFSRLLVLGALACLFALMASCLAPRSAAGSVSSRGTGFTADQ